MTIGIFYGSSGGNTAGIAKQLGGLLGIDAADIHDIATATTAKLASYDQLVLGTSTWGMGDLQDDWEAFDASDLDLSSKQVAIFGLGDADGYPDTFVDGMDDLRALAVGAGASLIGAWPTEGYSFDDSRAVSGDHFIGLVIDYDNQAELNDERLAAWAEQLKAAFV